MPLMPQSSAVLLSPTQVVAAVRLCGLCTVSQELRHFFTQSGGAYLGGFHQQPITQDDGAVYVVPPIDHFPKP